MDRDARHRRPHRGNPIFMINRFQPAQDITRLINFGGFGHIKPRQAFGIGDTPTRQLQRQWCQIGLGNFRRGKGRARTLFVFRPQAITDTRFETSRTTTALFGTCL